MKKILETQIEVKEAIKTIQAIDPFVKVKIGVVGEYTAECKSAKPITLVVKGENGCKVTPEILESLSTHFVRYYKHKVEIVDLDALTQVAEEQTKYLEKYNISLPLSLYTSIVQSTMYSDMDSWDAANILTDKTFKILKQLHMLIEVCRVGETLYTLCTNLEELEALDILTKDRIATICRGLSIMYLTQVQKLPKKMNENNSLYDVDKVKRMLKSAATEGVECPQSIVDYAVEILEDEYYVEVLKEVVEGLDE